MSKRNVGLIIRNANELLTLRNENAGPRTKEEMRNLGIIENGAVAIEKGRILAVGTTSEILNQFTASSVIDARGKVVMPGFVDCHTHFVFSDWREDEFSQKLQGKSYLDILKEGGGILSTVEKTREKLRGGLPEQCYGRLHRAFQHGTTTMEVKSGYGLNVESELAILNAIELFNQNPWVDLVPTFLGAHAVPLEFQDNKQGYVELVLGMLELLGGLGRTRKRPLAEFCDVFVERGAFSIEDARRILEKARDCGMGIKLHAGEFNDIGGVELGVELGAVSIDHLDHISDRGIERMAESKTIAVLLPGAPFHLMTNHYAPARKMIQSGVPVALATDFNPGSSPTFSMQMIIVLACRQMKMTVEEAIIAATINAAHAISRGHEIGSLEPDKKADIIILDIPNYKHLAYQFGMNLVEATIKNGKFVL